MLQKDYLLQIPEEHKKIVLERIKNPKLENLLNWNDVKDKLITSDNRANALQKTKKH